MFEQNKASFKAFINICTSNNSICLYTFSLNGCHTVQAFMTAFILTEFNFV